MSAATASNADGTIIGQIRYRFAQVVAVLIIAMPIFSIISQYSSGADIFAPSEILTNIFTVAVGIACLYLARSGRATQTGMLASGLMTIVAIIIDVDVVRILMSVLALIIAAALTPRWYNIVIGLLVQLPLALKLIEILTQTGFAPNIDALDPIVMFSLNAMVGLIFNYFYQATSDSSRSSEESYQRLASIAAVGQQTSRMLRLEDVLNDSVNLIREQFNFYHVQIFLVDDRREYAVLAASTGEAGRRLLARDHKLGVGSQSVIGRVTLGNESVPDQRYRERAGHKFNELLPETRAELALPMQMTISGVPRVMGRWTYRLKMHRIYADDVQALRRWQPARGRNS